VSAQDLTPLSNGSNATPALGKLALEVLVAVDTELGIVWKASATRQSASLRSAGGRDGLEFKGR
jgi:hypothetical protein